MTRRARVLLVVVPVLLLASIPLPMIDGDPWFSGPLYVLPLVALLLFKSDQIGEGGPGQGPSQGPAPARVEGP